MKRSAISTGLLAAGLAALLGVAPDAAAQTVDRGAYNPPGSGNRYPYPPPQPYQRLISPRPTSAPGALLDQDLMLMRATSRFPDQFLYGQYNPRFETVYPPSYYNTYPYGYGYGGYYNSYPYGGFSIYGQFGNGYGYGSFGFGAPSVLQREVIIIRDRASEGQPAAERPAPEKPRTQEKPQKPNGDFYLKDRPQSESISDALDDIRKAWLNGDFERMKARFNPEGKVRILIKGEYRQTMEGREFLALVKDAMTKLDTVSFDLDKPRAGEEGRALVTGKHVFIDPGKMRVETYISYTLERVEGRWKITEAGSSSTPLK